MRIMLIYLAVLIAAVSCKTRQTGTDAKLVGGDLVAEGDYPATFLLRTGCTATKIARNLILTAAHCAISREFKDIKPQYLPNEDQPMTLSLKRKVFRDVTFDDVVVKIKNTYVYPDYWQACQENCDKAQSVAFLTPNPADVAVIEIELPNPEFERIATAKIATRKIEAPASLEIMGYGCEEGANIPETGKMQLKHKQVSLLSIDELRQAPGVPAEIVNTFAGNFYQTPGQNWQIEQQPLGEKSASLCPGDSGGPAYVKEANELKVIAVNSFMINPEGDDDGISHINAHARIDSESSPRFHQWLRKINTSTTPETVGRNSENIARNNDLAELDECRYCHFQVELNEPLSLVGEKGEISPRSEWDILFIVHDALKEAGFKSWIYRNSVEVSKRRKKVWLNVKLLPGGNATREIERSRGWQVKTTALREALNKKGLKLVSVSSYIELLWQYRTN